MPLSTRLRNRIPEGGPVRTHSKGHSGSNEVGSYMDRRICQIQLECFSHTTKLRWCESEKTVSDEKLQVQEGEGAVGGGTFLLGTDSTGKNESEGRSGLPLPRIVNGHAPLG